MKGLFYGIGHQPNSQLVAGQIDLDDHGYVKVSACLKHALCQVTQYVKHALLAIVQLAQMVEVVHTMAVFVSSNQPRHPALEHFSNARIGS